MNRLVLVLALALTGCCEDASVITATGGPEGGAGLVQCYGTNWVTCVNTACPRGFDVQYGGNPINDGIIRCKP